MNAIVIEVAAPGPQGPEALLPAGEWAAGHYAPRSLVRHADAHWLAKIGTEQEPSDGASDWDLWFDYGGVFTQGVDARLATYATPDTDEEKLSTPADVVRRASRSISEQVYPTRADLLAYDLPAGQRSIRTIGRTIPGRGAADYVEIEGVPSPLGFTTPDGRRFEVVGPNSPAVGGAGGDGIVDDHAALADWLAAPGDKVGDRDATYRIGSGNLSAAKKVDLGGATVVISRPDRSASDAISLASFQNGNIHVDIPEPVNPGAPTDPSDPNFLRRVLRITQDGGIVENARFTSQQYLILAPVGGGFPGNSLDAFLRLDALRTTVRDVLFDKIDAPVIAVSGEIVRVERVEFNRARRGILSKPEVQRLIVHDCVFRSKSRYAFTDAGNNFMTGSPAIAEVSKCLIQGTGEHAVYLSCAYALPGLFANFDDITIAGYRLLSEEGAALDAGPGQCGIKLRNYGRVSIKGTTVQDCAADNTVGTNEDSFHIEFCDDVSITSSRGVRKVKATCANVGAYLQGVRKAWLSDLYFDSPAEAGVHIEEFTATGDFIARACSDIVGRDITVRGGIGLKISHATQEIGNVDIELNVIDAPGAPIDLSGIGTVAAGKTVRVSGRYSAVSAPIFPDSAQVDVANFVPATRETTSSVGATRAIAHLASDVINFTSYSSNMTSMGAAPRGAIRRLRNSHSAAVNLPTTPATTLQVGEEMTVRGAGGTTWLVDSRTGYQSTTAALIASAVAGINTSHKYKGKIVEDATSNRLLYALGPAPTDGWQVVDGSATVTPS